jgi:hypothetical protein
MIPFLHLFEKPYQKTTAPKYVEHMATQTEEEEISELSITNKIDQAIEYSATVNRFQEFTEKRNERIYKKIMFNIRNYVVLTSKEINEIRLLDDTQKMNIIILMNTAIKHLLQIF